MADDLVSISDFANNKAWCSHCLKVVNSQRLYQKIRGRTGFVISCLVCNKPIRIEWDNPRYLSASKVNENAILRLSPKGFCNWCGKALTGRSKSYCPPSEREIWEGHTEKDYWCAREFTVWWAVGNPRYKRVVLIRDKFTCQQCGLKPITQNKHGLEIPDLSLLHADHIYPVAKGGETKLDNLQCLCRDCNLKKGDKINPERCCQEVMEL